ncbi:zinc-binding dehydrogenase [Phyllobacterium calauticae]|uniref:zinc-binding dehydrogenase n=1 Tax=Phyllobacterium calauticae TaxID=2817027 RepID=UPI001CBE0D12|nr:zinc-binding dehydrogenase [Phyllobacterium calauticae]
MKDVQSLQPTADEVKITVRAFGLNRAETYLRAGKMGDITGPRTPGIEAVGEIASDASGTFRIGERVATAMGGMQFSRPGSYAEEVTVLRSNVVSLDGIDLAWEELAALPEAYLTVWGALDQSLAIEASQTILVRGATSSVGLAAVAYAKARGLTVIATSRSAGNGDRLRKAGADHVVVDNGTISDEVRKLFPNGIDSALEVVGASTLRDTIKTLKPFGAVSMIGLLGGAPVLNEFHLMQDLPAAIRLNFFQSGLLGTPAMPLSESPLRWVAEEVAAGRIPSLRSETFNFDDIRRAHTVIESNRGLGKLVVRL